jgi:RimJ/RimL family protein N-acetyltransferase
MLANSISGQLVAERQRALLHEASVQRLAREAGASRKGYAATVHDTVARITPQARASAAVRIRPIRPDDAELLRDGFARLSPESRRLRFFVAKKALSAAEVRYLTEVDHHDHEALVAVDRFSGRGLAVARYIRDRVDHDAADVAVAVVDEWQGRGLGTALVTRLAARARCEGVHRFTATVLEHNHGARRLLSKAGSPRLVGRDRDTLDYEIALAPVAAERRSIRWTMLAPASGGCGYA